MAAKRVDIPSENKLGTVPAMMAGDPTTMKQGLIVLQEWWGMNDQIQDCGKDLCGQGKIVTLVPDLYRGKVTTDNEEAGHFMGDLDWRGAVSDIQGCAKFLKSQGVLKVAVTGFCMGGALSMAGAALVPEIDAAVPFYGIPSAQLCDVTSIKVPMQCHFANNDQTAGFASPAEWKPLKKKLEEKLDMLEFYEYEAGHAFTNKTGDNYNKKLCDLAFSRMFIFLEKHLA